MYHRFLYTALLAPKESNINEYQTRSQYIFVDICGRTLKTRYFLKARCDTPFQHASTALRRVFKIQIAVQNSKSVATGFLSL